MTQWQKVEGGLKVDRTFPEKDQILGIGDSVEGRYVEKITGIGENNSVVYVLENEAKMRIGVWGSSVIDNKMQNIAIGKMVKLVFQGEKPSLKRVGKHYKDWDFFVGIDSVDEQIPF